MSISRILSACTLLVLALLFVSIRAQTCDNPPSSLTVHDLPFIDDSLSGFKTKDQLTLVVKSKMVNQRSDAVVTMKAGTAACNYPGTGNWVRSVDNTNCFEIWTATMPWSVAAGCGLNRTDNGTFLIFEAFIDVTQVDNITDIRSAPLLRTMNTSLVYQLVFPKTIEMATSQLAIYAPVSVQAAVVSQEYTPATAVGTIGLFVSVQWPFQLVNSPSISTDAASVGSLSISTSDSCSPTLDQACNRIYYINIPRGTACSLNGTYTVTSNIVCISGITEPGFECPVQTETGQIVFTLSTEDLCNRFNDVVDLSATLKSYLPDLTTERKAFIQGQTAYFEIVLSSNDVSIQAVSIEQITTNFGGSNTSVSVSTISESDAAKARFSFDVTNALFPLNADEHALATVYARVAVTFENSARKRGVMVKNVALNANNKRGLQYVQSAFASTQIDVSSSIISEEPVSSANTVVASLFALVVSVMLLF